MANTLGCLATEEGDTDLKGVGAHVTQLVNNMPVTFCLVWALNLRLSAYAERRLLQLLLASRFGEQRFFIACELQNHQCHGTEY